MGLLTMLYNYILYMVSVRVIVWNVLIIFYPSFLEFWIIFRKKTIISLVLAGFEMIIANLALRTLLAVYHAISNTHSLEE